MISTVINRWQVSMRWLPPVPCLVCGTRPSGCCTTWALPGQWGATMDETSYYLLFVGDFHHDSPWTWLNCQKMVVCHIFRHTMTHPKFHLAKMLQDAVRCPAAAACLPTFLLSSFSRSQTHSGSRWKWWLEWSLEAFASLDWLRVEGSSTTLSATWRKCCTFHWNGTQIFLIWYDYCIFSHHSPVADKIVQFVHSSILEKQLLAGKLI